MELLINCILLKGKMTECRRDMIRLEKLMYDYGL